LKDLILESTDSIACNAGRSEVMPLYMTMVTLRGSFTEDLIHVISWRASQCKNEAMIVTLPGVGHGALERTSVKWATSCIFVALSRSTKTKMSSTVGLVEDGSFPCRL
jgi:hypothetical protein